MSAPLSFSVEDIYSGRMRMGTVELSDEEWVQLRGFLRDVDGETGIYNADMEERLPDIFHRVNDVAERLMDEMDAEHPYGEYRVELEDVL